MERRRDYRHRVRYPISIRNPRQQVVLAGVQTRNVSASGLYFSSDDPHGLVFGDRIEIRLTAPVRGEQHLDMLVMATNAVVVRTQDRSGALRFEAPLSY